MADYVKMNKALSKIQSNEHIRTYLKTVAQDPQNETIDYVKTKANFAALCGIPRQEAFTARLTLITNLNDIFCLVNEISSHPTKGSTYLLWMWENHTRLTKMIAAAMVLEGENLRDMGAVPTFSDIPQSLVRLQHEVWFLEQSQKFDALEKEYLESMDQHGPAEFYELYASAAAASSP